LESKGLKMDILPVERKTNVRTKFQADYEQNGKGSPGEDVGWSDRYQ